MSEEFPTSYDPRQEEEMYRAWEQSGAFAPFGKSQIANRKSLLRSGDRRSGAPAFSMVLPPPNVTGTLHMGHAAMVAIEDILVRYHRMKGDKTVWIPGTDHAAIATQEKVEKEIHKKEGKSRHDLGREEFLRRVDAFAQESHDTIVKQIKRLGASLDWSREAFTLDEQRSLAVRTAFKKMYDAGLIYRGERIVNWDPKLQTTVSDDEIEWKEEKAPFYYLICGPFEIATARPETKFGDKYVVMHPADKRYAKYKHGETLNVEWIHGTVTATIIKDKAVDPAFGTGVMTITPWHDAADFDIANRHNLSREQIIDLRGKLLPIAGEFAGKKISEVRPLLVEKLKAKGLLVKIDENYVHRIAINSRGGGTIEPQVLKQWFVSVDTSFPPPASRIKGIKSGSKTTLKEIMAKAVKGGQIKITPKRFERIYFHWINNLRDWCISRQIWYGHRIPVWYCGERAKTMKRMGFAGDIVAQVFDAKTRTYRLRDHGIKVGDVVAFEDSAKKVVFGYGTITEVTVTTVGGIDLKDKKHWKTYAKRAGLIAAFKRHHPEMKVTASTPVWVYAYAFDKTVPADGCGTIVVAAETPTVCPGCGRSENLTQDPDTLDTWFSSGLWTFSTLGWPFDSAQGKPSKDFEMFHPTSVLETGYDIIFFWVARMILMTGFLLGDIPFKQVYLHGLVLDDKGRKMSKSLGNIIDPLDMANKYGADATRLSLVIGATDAHDIRLNEDRVRGYRNFATKIWNIARFIEMNREGRGTRNKVRGKRKITYTAQDKKDLKRFATLKKQVTKDIETFKFHAAAEALYHYVWHELADNIVEAAKPRLQGGGTDGAAALTKLETLLLGSLKLLHPFMPFVTEAVYQRLPERLQKKKFLMVEEW